MAISALTAGTDAAATTSAQSVNVDNEQRFLKLLVTQLNNQDPLNPMENAELTSQLAQMSTVSGIEKLNAAFQSLIAQSGSSQVLQAASMIGRSVLVPTQSVALQDGQPAAFAIETGASADAVGVDIVDRNGLVVRHLDLGPRAAGLHQLAWDGLDDQGQAVAAGTYQLQVSAAQDGVAVHAGALALQRVQSVAQGATGITLETGAGATALSAVRLIQ